MEDSAEQITNSQRETMAVVAIAASAGGLEALSLLAQNLTAGANCCYVIAQHMSPSHKSMLVQLLSRETSLVVDELTSKVEPKPDVIYIPPAGSDVVYSDGLLQLREPAGHPASPKPSADRLFFSIAEELGEHAIGVVLSGTGSDGSYGVRAIREQGGITIAQEPETCKYDSMPQSAIRTGCIDLTLTPQQIGEHISLLLATPRDLSILKELSQNRSRNRDLFDLLLSQTLVDFRQYKENTVNRRIQRRMIAKRIETLEEYVEYCRQSNEEVDALYRDLLISVTRFFRDRDQFDALRDELSRRYEAASTEKPIRVWVPGCATGEEAYSIAIMLCEVLGGLAEVPDDKIQIFATDIDESALTVARKGTYPVAALADVPEEYHERYFDISEDLVTVKRKLRNLVKFTRHNVFHDAPFSNIDLVSIRNVLIYFNAKLQQRVLTRVRFAINPEGLLFVGTSESLGPLEHAFKSLSPSARIFVRGDEKMGYRAETMLPERSDLYESARTRRRSAAVGVQDDWRYFDMLAKSVVERGILINRERTVLRVYGDLAGFSQVTDTTFGRANIDILQRPLAAEVASLSMVALKYGSPREGAWQSMPGSDTELVRVTAYPLQTDGALPEELALIGIETMVRSTEEASPEEDSEFSSYLEEELGRTRDALQVTTEQLQTSNEELQSVNEELQSSNEELQSTNEELETSNEELQSTNEELITVNEELLVNTNQLERVTAEMNGLIRKLPSVVVMLDRELMMNYASDSAIREFELRERGATYGHVSQCNLPEGYPAIVPMCSTAIVERKAQRKRFDVNSVAHELWIEPVDDQTGQLVGLIVQVQSMPT